MIDQRSGKARAGRRRPLWRIVRAGLLAYCIVLLLTMVFEERLIFFPLKYPAGDWNPPGLAVEDAHFAAADGTPLHGWYLPHPEPLAHVLFLHGNAGNVTHRAEALRILHQDVGVAVLILDYRGYGKSEGRPNEEGVLMDGRAARQWLAERAGIDEGDVVLLGRSLGSGVAVDMMTDLPPRAMVLETAFTSLPDVGAFHYPFLPVRTFMRTRLDSASKIGQYQGPLLQCHGTDDEIIPLRLGRQLFEAASTERKEFYEIRGATHNDMHPREYFQRLRQFLEEIDDQPRRPH